MNNLHRKAHPAFTPYYIPLPTQFMRKLSLFILSLLTTLCVVASHLRLQPQQPAVPAVHDSVTTDTTTTKQTTATPRTADAKPRVPKDEAAATDTTHRDSGKVDTENLGNTGNGPLTIRPARLGQTTTVLSQDSYGRGPVRRRRARAARGGCGSGRSDARYRRRCRRGSRGR